MKTSKKSLGMLRCKESKKSKGEIKELNDKSPITRSDFVMYNKACFICGSFDHVQAHCKYHQREMMKAVNTARPKSVNTARPKAVNTARPHSAVVNAVRVNHANVVKASTCFGIRDHKLNSASITLKKPQTLKHEADPPSGCSRHMTGNIAYLSNFKEFDGGYVTFGGGAHGGRISSKRTLKTDSLDFEDLPDESQIHLKVLEMNDTTVFGYEETLFLKRNLTCLVAKATSRLNTMLWPRDLGHINFKNINKVLRIILVHKENLMQDVGNGKPKSAADDQKQVEDGPHNESVENDKSEDDSSPKEVNVVGQHVNTASPEDNNGHFKLNTAELLQFKAPTGFKDPDHPDKVYKVVKALYVLHQAPKAWHETLANYLLGNGFKKGKIDQTLFIKNQKGDILLVQVYVDDIIFGSTNKELCTAFEKLIKDKFQMSSMGELTFFLGLQKFNYTDVKSASTLVDLENPLVKDGDADDVDVHLYRSMIGSLMYLIASRLDIMFAVCVCARFQVTPKTSNLLAIKRIFRYLKGKPTLGLWYSRDSPFELVAYTDSDYAGATQDKKSTTRGCQFLGNRHVKSGRDTKIPQSSGPPVKVGDEAVHKELGDRMEMAPLTLLLS
ncbi:putative ribonuclease H-like domain-containing protein [Tanacetum coccineum]